MQNCITRYIVPMKHLESIRKLPNRAVERPESSADRFPDSFLAAFLICCALIIPSCRDVENNLGIHLQNEKLLKLSIIRIDSIEGVNASSMLAVTCRIHNMSSEEMILDRRGLIGYQFVDRDGDVIPKVPESIPDAWVADKHKIVLSPDAHLNHQVIVSLSDVIESERAMIAGLRVYYSRGDIPINELVELDNLYQGTVFSGIHYLNKNEE